MKLYRAVVKVNDYHKLPEPYNNCPGAIGVWVINLSPSDDTILSYVVPGNLSFIGTQELYCGQIITPPIGSNVYVWYDDGNMKLGRYFGGLLIADNTAYPKENSVKDPQNVFTLFKSPKGKAIIFNDNEDRIVIKTNCDLSKTDMTSPENLYIDLDCNNSTIRLQTGDGDKQYIEMDKPNKTTSIVNYGSSIVMTEDTIYIQAGEIYLN